MAARQGQMPMTGRREGTGLGSVVYCRVLIDGQDTRQDKREVWVRCAERV